MWAKMMSRSEKMPLYSNSSYRNTTWSDVQKSANNKREIKLYDTQHCKIQQGCLVVWSSSSSGMLFFQPVNKQTLSSVLLTSCLSHSLLPVCQMYIDCRFLSCGVRLRPFVTIYRICFCLLTSWKPQKAPIVIYCLWTKKTPDIESPW